MPTIEYSRTSTTQTLPRLSSTMTTTLLASVRILSRNLPPSTTLPCNVSKWTSSLVSTPFSSLAQQQSPAPNQDDDDGHADKKESLPAETGQNNHQLIPFSVSAKIEGEESQIATVRLRPGETLRAESGSMLFMTEGIEMSTSLQNASSAFSRMMTGQNVFLTDFTYQGDKGGEGTVALGTDFPSKILRLSLEDYGGSLIAQRGAYLASNLSVDIQMEATKTLSAGFFGGQGFILQRLSGAGDVLVKAGGTLVTKELDDGEVIRVTSGSIVAFEPTVEYDIQMMPGIKNAMFGGEGLFVTTLKGPGKIWLQGMPPDRMIAEIARRVPAGGLGMGPIIPIGGMGGGDGGAASGETDADIPGAGVGDVAGSEAGVAASDAAVEADRQATVATSGIMDDDYSDPTFSNTTSSSDASDTFSETTFSDDGTTFNNPESTFSDEDTSFSTSDGGFDQPSSTQDFFGEDANTELFDTGAVEDATEAASQGTSSLLSTLWDIFFSDD